MDAGKNSLNGFVFEHRSGCCATEPGYAGDIGAIEMRLIDGLIDWLRFAYLYSSDVCCNTETAVNNNKHKKENENKKKKERKKERKRRRRRRRRRIP